MTPLYQLTDTGCILWVSIHGIHAARPAGELQFDIDIMRRRFDNALAEINDIRAGAVVPPRLLEARGANPPTLEARITFHYPLNGSDPIPRNRLHRCVEEWNFMPVGTLDPPKTKLAIRKRSPFRTRSEWVPKGAPRRSRR